MLSRFCRTVLTTAAIGLTLTNFPVAQASPAGSDRPGQMSADQMHERIKARMDKLADRLEIKASQQDAWDAYERSVEMLGERHEKKLGDDADAVTIARYRAGRATAFARKLTAIADATAKLQAVLTKDQQKILNEISRRSIERGRELRNRMGSRTQGGRE